MVTAPPRLSRERRSPKKDDAGCVRIVFDTETTGVEPGDGHRIVEIGCVELIDRFPTGKSFQVYLNPERLVPVVESQRIHGLSDEFLGDKPVFAQVVEEFLAFIGDVAAGDPQCQFRHQIRQCRTGAHRAPADSTFPRHRHDRDRQAEKSRARVIPWTNFANVLESRSFPARAQAWRYFLTPI